MTFCDSADVLTVGLTYDTRDDFHFTSKEPEDWDVEFEVSTAIDDIAHALEDLGHKVKFVGSGRKLLDTFREVESSVDIVFNIAEGYHGRAREAQVPSMLEMAGIPYVGSDSYTLSLALNKWHTKILARQYGIRTPAFQVVRTFDEIASCRPRTYPVISKPCYEGSSKGIREDSVAHNREQLKRGIEFLLRNYRQPVLVEKFIQGREVDVPIIGNSPTEAFGVVGLTLDGNDDLKDRFLTSKIIKDDRYGFKFPLRDSFVSEVEESALKLYNLLECRDFGRVDERIDYKGNPYFLEINPYPFLGRHSSFSEIATKTGLGYKKMIARILESALGRQQLRRKTELS